MSFFFVIKSINVKRLQKSTQYVCHSLKHVLFSFAFTKT